MSGRMVREVLENAPADLTKHELLVLVSLAESAFDKDRIARAQSSAECIADRTRSTPSAVRNILLALKARALIVPMIDRPMRGHAQQWYIPKLTPDHRRAMVRDDLPAETRSRNTASRRGDAIEAANAASNHSTASRPDDAINGTQRHAQMTQDPVDNPQPAESLASLSPVGQRHPQVTPPVKATPVKQFLGTQLPLEVSEADPTRAAIHGARRDR